MTDSIVDRRGFLWMTAGGGILLPSSRDGGQRGRGIQTKEKNEETEEVAPPEDLMREHGVLKRVLTDLTSVLRAQHQAGRRLTDQITQATTVQSLKDPSSAKPVVQAMEQFIRMYEPHEAREDTVL